MASPLSVDEVRAFVTDYAPDNLLIEGEEFTDAFITLCMDLAVDSYNTITPFSSYNLNTFPSKSLLLYGTCWHMFEGKAALLARNTMNYSDGGLQIPIEERFELYKNLANSFNQNFSDKGKALKINANMEAGWGGVRSDLSYLPLW